MPRELTEADVDRIIRQWRDGLTELRALLMAHIRQTSKLRAQPASTNSRVHTATGTLVAGAATVSGIGSVIQNTNSPPVWQTVQNIVFQQGVAAVAPVGGLVSDPENDPITITHNAASLPSGVTFDSANKRFSYDGTAASSATTGHQLSADDGADDTVVQFGLKSTSTGTAKPFCFPHEFKRGDIPQGRDIVANIPDFQATIVNRWSDGSAKIAILAGHLDLTANTTRFIDLKTGTANAGTAITEGQLIAAGVGTDTFQFGSLGTVTLSDVLGRLSSAKGVAGMISRDVNGNTGPRISGPEMSEFHYYSPVGTDNHLSLFLYIRFFKNGACEIEAKVENGWLKVPSPDVRTYAPTFTIGGTNRTASLGTLTHYNRTWWAAPYWRGTDPAIKPIRDVPYMLSTGLRPHYGFTSPSNATLAVYSTSTITPFAQGELPDAMSTGGDDKSLGLLQKHEALHCTSSDTRTFDAVVTNGYNLGRYSIHVRDEGTMRPIAFSSYPHLVINGSGIFAVGASSTNDYTPAQAGGTNAAYALSHLPSWGYIPYLETGRWSFLEECQFCAGINFLKNTDINREFTAGVLVPQASANQTRGTAWGLRALASAACVTQDGDSLQAEYLNSFASNMAYYVTNYVGTSNTLGVPAQSANYTPGGGILTYAPWMDDFLTACIGWAKDMGLALSPSGLSSLDTCLAWKVLAAAGRVGGVGPAAFCFRRAGNYNLKFSNSETYSTIADYNAMIFPDWATVYVENFGANTDCSSGSDLLGGNIDSTGLQTSYWGNFHIALAAAVDAGNAAALAGYQRMIAAPNYNTYKTAFNDDPRYGVTPRSV